MLKRLKRGLVVVVWVWLLVGLSYVGLAAADARADAPLYTTPTYLVVISYGDWADLQRLAPVGLDLLDWQVDRLAAIVSSEELASVRSLGFDVRVLDAPAAPGQYYLVTLPPTGEAASLDEYGQVFPYVPGAFILRAQPAEAELLFSAGFFVQNLLGPIAWPDSPPSVAAVAPGPHIQAYNPIVQNVVNAVSQTHIYTTILNLQDDDAVPGWDVGRSRYSDAPELSVERDYIRNRMQALGLDVRYQSFIYNGKSLDNIEGTLPGWGPGSEIVYIVCAHYDSTSNDPFNAAPGADDNASGTAAVLEAARVLSQYRFKHTLRFVTFAAEEQGLIGSYNYAAEAASAGTIIGGVINLDMIAWDSNNDKAMDIHAGLRSDSQALGTAFMDANTTYNIMLVPEFITAGATTRSDHASFWNRNYPAILAIEDFHSDGASDFNPYYHTTSDTLEKLNLPYATKMVRATAATLAELAQIIPPGINAGHAGPGLVSSGQPTTLTIQYGNVGPTLANDLVITETLGPGLTYVGDNSGFPKTQPTGATVVWQVGDLSSYTLGSFVVTASVGAGLPVGAHVTGTVDITGVIVWDDPGDNRASWVGTVPYPSYLPIIVKNH